MSCLIAHDAAEWSKAVAPWVALLLVVIGWFVNNAQANNREDRKEVRQLIDRAIKMIEAIAEQVVKVHTNVPDLSSTTADSVKAIVEFQSNLRKLKYSFSQLSQQLQLLRERGIRSSEITDALVELRQTAMGDDFETTDQKSWPSNDDRWYIVDGNCARLALLLERGFLQQYSP